MSKTRALTIVLLLSLSTMMVALPVASEGGGDRVAAPGRVVLAELVTAGWCPNCPNADGALEEMQGAYTRDELVILAYHRQDDLSFDDGDARMAFYASPYQPWVVFDGVVPVNGNKGSVEANRAAYEAAYDQRAAVGAVLDLTVEGWTDTTTGQGTVWVNVTAVGTPALADLRVHAMVFEDDFGPWNGGNGVLQHHWTAREALAGASGASLSITAGGTESLAYTYVATDYAQDLDEVGVVAFVQSAETKEVLQAGYTKEFRTSPVNSIPEFADPSVTPTAGDTGTTFRYGIGYRDMDDEAPVQAQVIIDGVAHDLTTESTGPWTMWTPFYYETALRVGDDHTYSFRFSDGDLVYLVPDGTSGPAHFEGPVVEPPSSAPTLSLAAVEPAEGDGLTLRTFSVIYTDGEGDAPAIAELVIDGVPRTMTGEGTDYTLGVTYTLSTVLSSGEHEYYYGFGDGVHGARLPAQGAYNVSVVDDLQRIVVLSSNAEDGEVVEGEELTIGLDGTGVPDGLIASYLWESDLDGELGRDAEATFTLSEGTHTITMTVTTTTGLTYSGSIQMVSLDAVPVPTIVDVQPSTDGPVEGDQVVIVVTVGNEGTADAVDLQVRLLDGTGDLIDTATIPGPIAPGGEADAQVVWDAVVGAHDLTIVVGGAERGLAFLVNENFAHYTEASVEGVDEGERAEVGVGEEVQFRTQVSDPEGDEVTYLWDFDDGTTSQEAEPAHGFEEAGTYTVRLTVTDSRGATSGDTLEVRVTEGSTPGMAASAALLVLLLSVSVLVAARRR